MRGSPIPHPSLSSASASLRGNPTQEHMSHKVPEPSPSLGTSRPSPTAQVSTLRWDTSLLGHQIHSFHPLPRYTSAIRKPPP